MRSNEKFLSPSLFLAIFNASAQTMEDSESPGPGVNFVCSTTVGTLVTCTGLVEAEILGAQVEEDVGLPLGMGLDCEYEDELCTLEEEGEPWLPGGVAVTIPSAVTVERSQSEEVLCV